MSEAPWNRPVVQLTPRGRRAASVGALLVAGVVLVVLLGLLRGCGADGQEQAVPSPSPSASSSSASPTPSRPASPTAAASSAQPKPDADGVVRTGAKGKGTWQVAPVAVPPSRKTAVRHRYLVKVEDGTGVDPRSSARQIAGILNDQRSWLGSEAISFELVKDPAKADFNIMLASPATVQKMCPLDVRMTWSCQSGGNVLINTDRWLYMTPTYQDLTQYRSYVINHEVGHYIGKGHVGCPAPGRKAPVMMQQSKALDRCKPNPWPVDDGK
ncbi:DUF3152 domain-containing protein [Luteococcus sp. OSA5]|uniref:DUF3152 domain-containing protein n=1 Tax=Luteococcus sp. OSA5 TaxID=3401630 RepID=UPI003B4302BB